MKRSIRKSNRSKKYNRSRRKRISRRRTRKYRRSSKKYRHRYRKYKRTSRKKRRSMKGGEMSRLEKIGIGATTGGLVGAAGAAAGAAAKMAVGGDKFSLATTLGVGAVGGAVGAVVGAGIGELKARSSMKIYATKVSIQGNDSTEKDNYDPEYIGTLNRQRLSEIFDRNCPYNRDVFNELFSPLQQKLQDMTDNPKPKLFGKNDRIWNSSDNLSRTFLFGLITRCIYVRSNSNTLIISVITGNYLHNGNYSIFTEVIPSYYLVTDMTACIPQNNPLVETEISAFSLYEVFSETEIGDNICPKSQIRSDLHQEPELDRWIIPRNVPVEII